MKDVLLLGYNEIDFPTHVKNVENNKGEAFSLSYNYTLYDNRECTQNDLYNICKSEFDKYGDYDSSSNLDGSVAYLCTYFEKNNVSYDYVNSYRKDSEKLKEMLIHNSYLVIGITTTLYVDAAPITEIIKFVRNYSEAKIVLGGQYIYGLLYYCDDTMKSYFHRKLRADYYIVSIHGEETICELITALKQPDPNYHIDRISNLMYFVNNKVSAYHYYTEKNNLEENSVKWSLLKNERPYFITLRTTLSCPFHCSFCEYPIRGGDYSYVSLEQIKYQLDEARSIGTVKHIFFGDDSFNIPVERYKAILKMMIKENYDFTWNALLRCQSLDDEVLELMVASKCRGISVGIESASNIVLTNMNKKITSEDYYKTLSRIKRYDIPLFLSFIIGFPGETDETFNETVNLINSVKPDFYRHHVWYASPLAPIMAKRDQYNIKGERYSWSHNTMDCEHAMKLYDQMYNSIKSSTWCPQHHFGFFGVMHLLARGNTINQVKDFIEVFNECVREKSRTNDNISPDYITRMKQILSRK